MASRLVIIGATGNQGGAVARAALSDTERPFAVRVVTRDPTRPAAAALAARGAEVVKADPDDAASLKRAFDGAAAAFCVTNYWARASAEGEKAHARNLAEAAKAASVGHVVWSTLEDSRRVIPPDDARMPILQGRYRVPNYDAKAEANEYFRGLPTTFLMPSFYWDNFCVPGLGPRKGPDGIYGWALPLGRARLAGIAVEDIGKAAYALLKGGASTAGTTIGLVGESLPVAELAERLSRALGVRVRYDDVPPDVFRGFGFPGADVVGNMYQFYRDFEQPILAARSAEATRRLVPDLLTFDGWLARNKQRIPL